MCSLLKWIGCRWEEEKICQRQWSHLNFINSCFWMEFLRFHENEIFTLEPNIETMCHNHMPITCPLQLNANEGVACHSARGRQPESIGECVCAFYCLLFISLLLSGLRIDDSSYYQSNRLLFLLTRIRTHSQMSFMAYRIALCSRKIASTVPNHNMHAPHTHTEPTLTHVRRIRRNR